MWQGSFNDFQCWSRRIFKPSMSDTGTDAMLCVQLCGFLCYCGPSSTIINSRVFTRQAAHVQIHLVHVVVSGNCEAILDRCWIIFIAAWRSRNVGNPLQAFSFSLSDPADKSRVIRYPCICTRQFVGFSGPLHRRFRFSQSLTANTWGENQFGYRTETNMSLDDKDEECRGLEFTRNGRQQQNCETFS